MDVVSTLYVILSINFMVSM